MGSRREHVRHMRLLTFSSGSDLPHVGVEVPCSSPAALLDLTAAYAADGRSLAGGMKQLISEGDGVQEFVNVMLNTGLHQLPLASVRVLAPIYDPEKVLCVGMNYRDHCTEQNFPIPEVPLLFNKFASSIIGPGEDITAYREITCQLDFEVELVVIVGRAGRNIARDEAASHIFGYTVAHDVSARDMQFKSNGGQWLLGKALDTFAPIGPAVVTRDEMGDEPKVGIRCRVNGVVMQNSNTRELVHGPADVIAYASRFMTLKPGDMILTGTPGGVGCFRKPPIWLKDGDQVECEIDGIGCITNTVRVLPAPKL